MSVISVEKLSYQYPGGGVEAVREVSFEVGRGEVFGFLGPSGAGKSTMQKVLTRLLPGYSGSAQVFGQDLSSWGDNFYENIGVCFELPASYLKLTARENLDLFAVLYRNEVRTTDDLLEQVGLLDAADQRLSEFSKGMQIRLNFARSLLNRPELLFLDEPTGGLDPGNAARIKKIIRAQRTAGTTVFLTTHDMMVADELCDRVAFIVEGKIPIIDTPRELKLNYGDAVVDIKWRDDTGLDRQSVPLGSFDSRSLAESLNALQSGGRRIETIHSREATLEQVFLKVTGSSLQ